MSSALDDFLKGRKYPSDLVLVLAWSYLSAAGILLLADGNILRIILALPLLLFCSGYALVSAFWPESGKKPASKERKTKSTHKRSIENMERIVFSIGLSIVIIPFLGLMLNYVWSISLTSIIAFLLTFTTVCSIAAWYRRMALPPGERFRISFKIDLKSSMNEGSKTDKIITSVLVVLIVIAMSFLIAIIIMPTETASYSELYILDQNRTLNNLTDTLTTNETGIVIIGLESHGLESVNYTIVASIDNTSQTQTYVDPDRQIILDPSFTVLTNITLTDSEVFEQEYSFQFSTPGRYKIIWNLLIDDRETEYQLHLWVNVT